MKLNTKLTHVLGAAAPSSEGEENYDSTREILRFHDGVRARSIPELGYMPYAYAIGCGPRDVATTTLALAAAAGGVASAAATCVVLEGHMLLESITIRELSTAQQRGAVTFYVYEDERNTNSAIPVIASATLAQFTPSAASNRTATVNSAPVYLPPGTYWVLARNDNTARALNLGVIAGGTMGQDVMQTHTSVLASPSVPASLATGWTKATTPWTGLRLNGRVFGQAAAF